MSADPRTIRYTIPCAYIGLNGLCGKPCFRGVCTRHRDRKPLQLCLRCGVRGTTAPHGYCSNRESGCQWRAQYRSKLAKAERDEMAALIDDILSWEWPVPQYGAAAQPELVWSVPKARRRPQSASDPQQGTSKAL